MSNHGDMIGLGPTRRAPNLVKERLVLYLLEGLKLTNYSWNTLPSRGVEASTRYGSTLVKKSRGIPSMSRNDKSEDG